MKKNYKDKCNRIHFIVDNEKLYCVPNVNKFMARKTINKTNGTKIFTIFFFVTIVEPTYCGWFIKMMLVVNLSINNVDSITSYFNLRICEKKGSNKIMFDPIIAIIGTICFFFFLTY